MRLVPQSLSYYCSVNALALFVSLSRLVSMQLNALKVFLDVSQFHNAILFNACLEQAFRLFFFSQSNQAVTEKVSTMFNSSEKKVIPAVIFEASPCNEKIVVYTKYLGRIVAHDFFNNANEAIDALPVLKKRVDSLVLDCGIINSVYN